MLQLVNKLVVRPQSANNVSKIKLKPTNSHSIKKKSYYLVRGVQENRTFVKSRPKISTDKEKRKNQIQLNNHIQFNRSVQLQQKTSHHSPQKIQKYIQQWKTLQTKTSKTWNRVSYNNKFSNVIIQLSNNQPLQKKICPQLTIHQHSKGFNIQKYQSLLKLNINKVDMHSSLDNYFRLLSANTSNKNYITIQIQPNNDYTNYLKQIALSICDHNHQIGKNIYFCCLMGENVDPYCFFWVGIPVMHYDRIEILKQIKLFLGDLKKSSSQDWTIWIVDWRGRVSYIKYQTLLKQKLQGTTILKKHTQSITKRKWNQRSIIGIKKMIESVE